MSRPTNKKGFLEFINEDARADYAQAADMLIALPSVLVADANSLSNAAVTKSFTALSINATGDTNAAPSALAVNAAVPVKTAPAVTITDGATAEIDGASAQSVTFTGTTGTLKLDHSLAFSGQVSGLAGSDAIDLVDVSYGPNTTATFLGNTSGGTLTITNGSQTANIALQGNYLSSHWTVSSDGNGGTVVVDPVPANNWQTLKVGAGGFLTGIDIAPDDTMVVRTDTYGGYIWNGTQWQQLVTATSMPASFAIPSAAGNQGAYEIQIAPSNSNILYMMFEGYIFQSSNKGSTWTQTSFAQVAEDTAWQRPVPFLRSENGRRSQQSQCGLCRNAAEWSICYDEWWGQLAKHKRCAGEYGG